jgi:hypothetical protein
MKKPFLKAARLSLLMITAFSLTVVSCSDDDSNPINNPGANAPDVDFTALTTGNKIAYYNTRNLSAPTSTLDITGLQPSETILSIDYRPATGQLYALGSTSRLYFINEQSGLATALGAAAFTPAIASQNASIDFNPTVDRIRLVTDSGQNLRLHPELGTVAATDEERLPRSVPLPTRTVWPEQAPQCFTTSIFNKTNCTSRTRQTTEASNWLET